MNKIIPHDSARVNVQGLSQFIDDRPKLTNEVLVTVVSSPVAAGILEEIDFSEALKMPGILAAFKAQDFKFNLWGSIRQDQPLLAEKEIKYLSEPIALLVGMDRTALLAAKKKIKLKIHAKEAILSIDQSIAAGTFLYESKPISRGDLDFSKNCLEGSFSNGGQEHFYLETQAAIAYPLEDAQVEIHSSTQHPSEVQHLVAKALGLKQNDVVCIVKRMGGAFGGKESQAGPFAAYAALAAQKLSRPARVVLDQEDDFRITGKRHPFKSDYKVGFDDQGKIESLKVDFYSDAGAYLDLSPSILDRALYHGDGCYFIPNIHFTGKACFTNTHSNTAFRGFGGPQGNLVIEFIIEKIASHLGLDPLTIRERNLYKEGQTTPYGQAVVKNKLPKIYTRLAQSSNYWERREKIKKFNEKKSGKIRGISFNGVKFGIAFTSRFLNQGNAQVNLHRDTTIQVSTGATEMGQGVNTKIQQIVAKEFGINSDLVRVMPTSTEKNHNTSPTAASSGTDINGAAAQLACWEIKEKLAWAFYAKLNNILVDGEIENFRPGKIDLALFKFENGKLKHASSEISLKEIVEFAYRNRISLGAYAFYRTPALESKSPFRYFTTGAAVSEVEIDEYTGQSKILKVDVLMDLGRTINEGIDKGQVTGGFIQGAGWVTSENLYYDRQGRLLSCSPTTYKIPNIQDTPRQFVVNLIENKLHEEAIYGSKAVGEPPLLLGAGVFLAILDAIHYRNPMTKMTAPATPEAILMNLKIARAADGT